MITTLIIGAGPSGLSAAYKLDQQGITDWLIVDRAARVGGTWATNDYPGLCCDVPSELYSLGFAPKSDWSRVFAPQAEIQRYLQDVAEQFGLMDRVQLETEVLGCDWDEGASCWAVQTSRGDYRARVLVAAPGFIGEPQWPALPGLSDFRGKLVHSAQWDHQHNFTAERIAIVGSGASAIQLLPQLQPKVQQLYSVQRTPAWVLPKPDFKMPSVVSQTFRRLPLAQKAIRQGALMATELNLPVFKRQWLLGALAHPIGRFNILRGIDDPRLRQQLTPNFPLGCKRPLLSNDWYPALAQPNVEVICAGVDAVTASGLTLSTGRQLAVDTIVLATGYAVSDPKIFRLIRGRQSRSISAVWGERPQATYGMLIPEFPNFFLMLGPNSHSVQGSVMVTSEWQAGYLAKAIAQLSNSEFAQFEIRPEVHADFNRRLDQQLGRLPIRADNCQSYYLDASGRNRFVWPESGWQIYRQLKQFRREDYYFSA